VSRGAEHQSSAISLLWRLERDLERAIVTPMGHALIRYLHLFKCSRLLELDALKWHGSFDQAPEIERATSALVRAAVN
jgi:hypothetical protein